MKKFRYFILVIFLVNLVSARVADTMVSQSHILKEQKNLKKLQDNISLQIDFNKAVLFMEQERYKEAILKFKKTAKILKLPSLLNMGIAYYKLKDYKSAKYVLEEIYKLEKRIKKDYGNLNKLYKKASPKLKKKLDEKKRNLLKQYQDGLFTYLSASFYLYKITEDTEYLDNIIKIANNRKNISEYAKRILLTAYILEKKYKQALNIVESLNEPSYLKKALLHIKLKNYNKAMVFLEQANGATKNLKLQDEILWFTIYVDILSGNTKKLLDDIEKVQKKKRFFRANRKLPFKIYFEKYKYNSDTYFKRLSYFTINQAIDYIFYFAPFVFSDNEEIFYDSSKGFIFGEQKSIDALEKMVEYNRKFLKIVRMDPILRAIRLKELLKTNKKAYIYYNLALSYAQVDNFHTAYKYFKKAYKLNPGNKLYSVMTLLAAKRVNITVNDHDYIKANIKQPNGLYHYFGLTIYKIIFEPKSVKKIADAKKRYKKTIFYKSIKMLENIPSKGIDLKSALLKTEYKDPFVYLMKLIARRKGENKVRYIKRIQDSVRLNSNSIFLKGSLVVTKYYIDILKATGLLDKANFIVDDEVLKPAYLRVKALYDIHTKNPELAITTLEYLIRKYNLNDAYTRYLLVAAYLKNKDFGIASLEIENILRTLNDRDAQFLSAIQLLQALKIKTAKKYFMYRFNNDFIDFKLVGFDKYLENL